MTVQFALAPTSWTPFHKDNEAKPALGPVTHFDQDCEIYGEGDGADYYYKVVSGMVRTCKFFADGRRQIDGFHAAGDLFGVETGGEHSLTAEAVNDCSIVAIRRGNVESSTQLLPELLRNLGRAQQHAVLLGRRSAVEKVSAFLLLLADEAAARGEAVITLPMTRQDIGDYLGLTIETVSRTIWQFERDDILELPAARQIKIKDYDALVDLRG